MARTKPVHATFVVQNDRMVPSKIDGRISQFITKQGHPVAGSWSDMFMLAKAVGGSVMRRPANTPVIPFRD